MSWKREKVIQNLKKAKIILEAWCMMMVLIMNQNLIPSWELSSHVDTSTGFRLALAKLYSSIDSKGIVPLVLFVIFLTFYWQIAKIPMYQSSWPTHVVAAMFSVFVIIGNSFSKTQGLSLVIGDEAQVIKSIIAFIGYYGMFHPCIKILYMQFGKERYFKREESKKKWVSFLFDRHVFFSSFLIISLAWLPYLIGYYPGIFMGDSSAQISQFFQIENGTSEYLNLISENQLINNHHPVLHTILMGGFTKIGRVLFQSDNLGIFMYTLLQFIFCALVLAYGIWYLKKLKVPYWFQTIGIVLAGFYPVIGRYVVLLSKDTIFSAFVMLLILQLLDLVEDPKLLAKSPRRTVFLALTMIGTMLFRQNGLYIVLFTLPLFLLWKGNRKAVLRGICMFAAVLGVYVVYMHVLLPAFLITPGSQREMLSVPFQQTARYVKCYEDEVTDEEREAIDQVLDYETLAANYDPNISDPVKATYNEDATKAELKAYFKVWLQMFLKHPGTYIQATLNNYYGYFYMGEESADRRVRYYQGWSTKCIEQRADIKGFHFHHLEGFKELRVRIEAYAETVLHLPILSMLQASAFYTWLTILFVFYIIWKKKYKYLIPFLPMLCIILVCFVSPVNGTIYFRYMLPGMFVMPVLVAMCIRSQKNV